MNSNIKKCCTVLAVSILAPALFIQTSDAQILMSGGAYSQNFNTLASTNTAVTNWVDNTTLPGWYAAKEKGGAFTNYTVSNGAGTSSALYSFGSTGNGERALGSLVNSTPGSIAYGVRFTNNTALSMTNITISYTGEQWRRQNTNQQTLAFSYVLSSSPITNADAAGTNYSWIAFPTQTRPPLHLPITPPPSAPITPAPASASLKLPRPLLPQARRTRRVAPSAKDAPKNRVFTG